MLGYLVIAAFAIYYLMPKPITGPSSDPQPSSEVSPASDIPKNGKVDTYNVPTNSH